MSIVNLREFGLSPVWQISEDYLNWRGRNYKIIEVAPETITLTLDSNKKVKNIQQDKKSITLSFEKNDSKKSKSELLILVLKIISYVSFILPLVAFGIRKYYRNQYNLLIKSSNTAQAITPKNSEIKKKEDNTEVKVEDEPKKEEPIEINKTLQSNSQTSQNSTDIAPVPVEIKPKTIPCHEVIEITFLRIKSYLFEKTKLHNKDWYKEILTFNQFLKNQNIENFAHKTPEEKRALFINYQQSFSKKGKLTELLSTEHDNRRSVPSLDKINKHLQNIWNYFEGQEDIITILYQELNILFKNDTTPQEFENSKEIYKKVFHFFKNKIEDNEQEFFATISSLGLDSSTISSDPAENLQITEQLKILTKEMDKVRSQHYSVLYLLSLMRKKIKTKECDAKIRRLISPSEPINDQTEKALSYLSISWVHGTKLFAVDSASRHTERKILPTGELRKRHIQILNGEMQNGATNRNENYLSGVDLLNVNKSINDYARQFDFSLDSEVNKMLKLLEKKFEYFEDFLDRGEFHRMVEAVKRVKCQRPDLYKEKKSLLQDKINFIYEKLEEIVFKPKPQEIFDWNDEYHTIKFNTFLKSMRVLEGIVASENSPEHTPIGKDILGIVNIPVILASHTKFGIPAAGGEYCIHGGLELGKDITTIFADQGDIPKVKEILTLHQLDDKVNVDSMAVLEKASQIEQKLKKYFNPFKD